MFEFYYKLLWISAQVIGFLGVAVYLGQKILFELRAMHVAKISLADLVRNPFGHGMDASVNAIFLTLQQKSKYVCQWKRYFERASQNETDDKLRVEPYLGAEVLLYHTGYRAWMDTLPGLFVSFGVLGTFIGLAIGLGGLSHADVNSMKTGIFVLLSGMRYAFVTSIVGIASGFAWSIFDRLSTQYLERQIDWHAEQLAMLLNPDEEEIFLQRMEKISKNQAEHLKTILTDALEQAMKPAFAGLQAGLDSQNILLEQQVELSRSQSADITQHLLDEITGGTKETMERFQTVVTTTADMQETMLMVLDGVIDRFSTTEKIHTELLTHLQQTSSMVREQFERFTKVLSGLVDEMDDMGTEMRDIGSQISNVQQHVQEMQAIEERLIPQLVALREDGTSMMSELQAHSKQHVQNIESQIQLMASQWKDTREILQGTNETLQTSMKDFAENVDQGLSKTYLHFDNTLTGAVREVTKLIEQLNGLYDELIEGVEEIATALHPVKVADNV